MPSVHIYGVTAGHVGGNVDVVVVDTYTVVGVVVDTYTVVGVVVDTYTVVGVVVDTYTVVGVVANDVVTHIIVAPTY